MDNFNDITDDLLGLPGFVRRNLLLIRELDIKSSYLFNEANKLSQSVFGTDYDTEHRTTSSFDKFSTISAPSSTVSFASVKKEDTPPSKVASSRSSKSKHDSERSSNPKTVSKRRSSRDLSSDNDSEHLFFEHTKQFDEIQNLRMQGIYVLQEKIDVNSQISSMLKYEYENLKTKFDSLYSEMELKGQIPHELKVYMSSNKKKYQSYGQYENNETGQAPKNGDKPIASNQLDIATMFRNVVNSQSNLKSEEKTEESEPSARDLDEPSKLVNRQ